MLDKIFKLKAQNTTISTEIIAGCITFLASSYILFVAPTVLAETGIDRGQLFVSICLGASISCIILAFATNTPIMGAPGVSMSVLLVYDIIVNGHYDYRTALLIVVLSSLISVVIFLLVPAIHVISSVPKSLRNGIIAGSGLFLVVIGLKLGGVIVPDLSTISALGQVYSYSFLFTISLLILLLISYNYNIRYFSILSLSCFILATIMNMFLMHDANIAGSILQNVNTHFTLPFYFPDLSKFKIALLPLIIGFIFASNYDSLGTFLVYRETTPTMTENQAASLFKRLLVTRNVNSIFSALIGAPAVSLFLESTTGIQSGGKTGLVTLVIGILFLLSLVIKPFLSLIPAWGSAPVLICIGIFILISSLQSFEWDDHTEYIPALFALIFIPFTYSITKGIAIGLISYTLIKVCSGKFREINLITLILSIILAIILL